eukprot:1161806-Pelagomonas_calceolata.AAC.2
MSMECGGRAVQRHWNFREASTPEMMSRICLLVVLLLATGFSASQAQQDASGSGSVCFVVRTFWGHGEDYGDRWDAYLVVLDDRPFPDLQKVVSKQGDDRIWIFSEWVGLHVTYVCCYACSLLLFLP